jgi:RHS repeat-associated protein
LYTLNVVAAARWVGTANTAARHFAYDAVGRPTAVNSPSGNIAYTWNDRGLLTATTATSGNSTLAYDGEDNLTSRTDVSGTATFTYDAAGRLATAVDPLTTRTLTYGYNPAGRLGSIGFGTGAASRVYTYDNLGRLATDTWRKPDNSASASVTYNYDTDSLLTGKTITGVAGAGSNTYSYDGLGRLTTWTNPAAQTTTYGYDGASNRTTVTTAAGTRTSVFDERNRRTSVSGAGLPTETYTYSARGTTATKVVSGQTTTYTFDAFERMTTSQSPTVTDTYTYDSLDRLAQRNGTALSYGDFSNDAAKVPVAGGTALVSRAPDGTPLASKVGTGTATTLLADWRHGDVFASANPATGVLASSATYYPWGTPTASTGSLPLGFQGGLTDTDTGQVNAHARWYNPSAGAFTSRDTWTLDDRGRPEQLLSVCRSEPAESGRPGRP